MATEYTNRLYVFIPVALKGQANTFCKNNFPGMDNELRTFDVIEFQTAGAVTHLGANTALTQGMQQTLAPLKNLAGAFWAIVDNATHELHSTNIPASSGKIGQVYEFDECMTDAGLTRKVPAQ